MKIILSATRFPHNLPMYTYTNVMVLLRKDTEPRIIMQDVNAITDGGVAGHSVSNQHYRTPYITGNLINDFSFDELQDGDVLCYPDTYENNIEVEAYTNGDMLLPFETTGTLSSLLLGLEYSSSFYICPPSKQIVLEQAIRIYKTIARLYKTYPAYKHIMLCHDGQAKAYSLIELINMSPDDIRQKIEGVLPAFIQNDTFSLYRASITAKRIIDYLKYDNSFQLLTQEDQVSAFIEFSRLTSTTKREYVPDELLDAIRQSDEYAQITEKLAENNLGISETQQFNVLQQVGYFSSPKNSNILYNLSDMGAGKTLMTVEAICLLDLKFMSKWQSEQDDMFSLVNEEVNRTKQDNNFNCSEHIQDIHLPDKNIIAPTLSIKSSWIATFQLFYDVENIDEYTYRLALTRNGVTAYSYLYISSFTIKNNLTYVTQPLPASGPNAYLIIDELHQLVYRAVSRTKFFQPKTVPSEEYKCFILSGTLSNLQTHQWYNYIRFIGIPLYNESASQLKTKLESQSHMLCSSIEQATRDIMTEQHRQFDCDDMSDENTYQPDIPKKKTTYEGKFFLDYGTHILSPKQNLEEPTSVESLLISTRESLRLFDNPEQIDTTNFQLFYKLVGSQAITAQSQVIAEELFGQQQQQHISDIIKTVSPLSKEDVLILKTLHHIAEDYNKYKSVSIANVINTAILNLNDGLQTKNIYDIISHFAEKNIRFFEYLATLDINVLERLPQSQLIAMPKLEDTEKFKILQDILQREKNETHLIVVNDFHAVKILSAALGIDCITKDQLRDELEYQSTLDALFEKQSIVIVPQSMIKSSLDLVQANRLIQYQLNTEISDIIQTQNRINRIGQTRETRGYYIASDQLQENLIELFLTSYRNIRVAHKGIIELFVDITSQINIVNNYLSKALSTLEGVDTIEDIEYDDDTTEATVEISSDVENTQLLEDDQEIVANDNITTAILYPQNDKVLVLVPLTDGSPFQLGTLSTNAIERLNVVDPMQVQLDIITLTIL